MNTQKQMHQLIILLVSMSMVFFVALHSVQAQNTASSLKKISMTDLKSLERIHGIYLRDSLQDERKALLKKKLSIEKVSEEPNPVSIPVVYDARGKALLLSIKKDSFSTASIKTEKNDTSFQIDAKQYKSVKNRAVANAVKETGSVKKVALRSTQETVSKSVSISAGGLYDALKQTERNTVTDLTISGTIDARDFRIMRDSMPALQILDISGAEINAYTGIDGTTGTDGTGSKKTYGANNIPGSAFSECYNLISITLSSSVDTIGYYAFEDCENMTSFQLPSSSALKYITDGAFNYCESLDSIFIPNTVTYIGADAFGDCYSLRSVFIPSTVSAIGEYAFADCRADITVDADNPNYSSEEGVLYDKDKSILIQCPLYRSGDFVIPATVRTIGPAAFNHCSGITAISMPDLVTTISSEAFYDCSGLSSFTIPKTVTAIGLRAFMKCSGLTSIYVESATPVNLDNQYNVFTEVNKSTCILYVPAESKTAYQSATQWKDFTNIVEISSKTVNITAGGLYNALTSSERENLTSLTVTGMMDARDFKIMRDSMSNLGNIDLSGVTIAAYTGTDGTSYEENAIPQSAFMNPTTYLVHSLTSIMLPTTLAKIGDFAFLGNTLTSLSIPSSVTCIGEWAFYNCDGLTSIDIPTSVTVLGSCAFCFCDGLLSATIAADTIGANAFADCNSIRNLTLTSDVSIIGEWAFYNCDGLTSIDIPTSVNKIGTEAFSFCDGLLSATIAADTIGAGAFAYCSIRNLTLTSDVSIIEESAFYSCSGFQSVSVPSSVRKIRTEAFSFCDGLLSATIAADTIGTYAFYGCDNLKSVKVTNDVTLIGNGAFGYNPLLESANVAAKTIGQLAFADCYNLKDLYLATEVTTIMSLAFIRCYSLSSVDIPSTVKTIGNCAFGACQGPFIVNVDNSVYASENGLLYNKDQSTLLQCPYHLNKYTFPSTVKCIALCAFYGCDSLTSLIIPSTVDSIGRGAFYYCQNLDSIVFSPSLKYIGEGAFVECDSIQHVVVPDGMNMISPGLFKDCGNLRSITIPSSIDSIGFSAFKNCNVLDTIYCPRVNPPVFRMIEKEKDVYDCFTNSKTVDDYGDYAEDQDYNSYEGYLYEVVFDMFDPKDDQSYDVFRPFYGVDTTTCTVLVPQESLEAYRSADQWKSFSHIVALKAFCLPDSAEAFTAAGGSVSIPVTTNTTWTVETTDPWLSVFPSSGNGNDTVTVEVTANKTSLSRSGLLIFTADGAGTRTLSIEQQSGKIQLTITTPTVKTTKTYDGTRTATIISVGTLQNVDTKNAGDVSVTGVANYESTTVGSGIKIIIAYTLNGSDNAGYLVPVNDTLKGSITAKQLTISTPVVTLSKPYDGITTAEIKEPGVLSGVEVVDEDKVDVIQTASYDNAEIGSNKTITVIFTLSGSSSDNYLAPPNYQIGGAEIVEVVSDKKPVLDSIILDSIDCGGSVLDILYTVKSGTPVQYRIDFDAQANIAGLNDISYTDLSSLDSGIITVPTPDSMAYGTYTGILQVRNNNGDESAEYPFQFLIQLSKNYIVDKFDDIVLFDNSSGQYCGYQWYKNGLLIDGATLQYFIDSEGLIGSYSVKVTTNDGEEVWTCSKSFNIPLEPEVSVAVFPNPAKANQPVTIRIAGMSDSELQGTSLSLYDLNGIQVATYGHLLTDNQFVFGRSDGAYIGHLVMPSGRVIQFMVVVK
jgi:hypothetical protein